MVHILCTMRNQPITRTKSAFFKSTSAVRMLICHDLRAAGTRFCGDFELHNIGNQSPSPLFTAEVCLNSLGGNKKLQTQLYTDFERIHENRVLRFFVSGGSF